jgi:hypothetical protein
MIIEYEFRCTTRPITELPSTPMGSYTASIVTRDGRQILRIAYDEKDPNLLLSMEHQIDPRARFAGVSASHGCPRSSN